MFEVEYFNARRMSWVTAYFSSQEEAEDFVKANQNLWVDFSVKHDGEYVDLAEFLFRGNVVKMQYA